MRPLGFQSYLKVWIGHTSGDLFEQRLLDFNELRWFNDVQNLLNFPKKHHLNLYLKNLKREPVQRRKQTVVREKIMTADGCTVGEVYVQIYLFLAAGFGPELQQTTDDLHGRQVFIYTFWLI